MCCRVSEEVIKQDTVILLVETYVLTVELNEKDYRHTAASFQFIHSLIESKMLTENTHMFVKHGQCFSNNGRPEERAMPLF